MNDKDKKPPKEDWFEKALKEVKQAIKDNPKDNRNEREGKTGTENKRG